MTKMSRGRSRAKGRWGITQNSADPQSAVCGASSLFIECCPTNQSSLGILKHNPLQFSCRPKAHCHSLHTPVQRALVPPRHAPRRCRKVDTIKARLERDARSDLTGVSHPSPTQRRPASAKNQRWVRLLRRPIMKHPPRNDTVSHTVRMETLKLQNTQKEWLSLELYTLFLGDNLLVNIISSKSLIGGCYCSNSTPWYGVQRKWCQNNSYFPDNWE